MLRWALIPKHFHLLLRTGKVPISTVMRRLLTGYAVSFNRRHRRYGHLFQNRFKSILCQEDLYLKELVGYIHLNPLRAKIVVELKELANYPYNGHCAIMGKLKRDFQDVDYVLCLFGDKVAVIRDGRYLETGKSTAASQGQESGLLLGRQKIGHERNQRGKIAGH